MHQGTYWRVNDGVTARPCHTAFTYKERATTVLDQASTRRFLQQHIMWTVVGTHTHTHTRRRPSPTPFPDLTNSNLRNFYLKSKKKKITFVKPGETELQCGNGEGRTLVGDNAVRGWSCCGRYVSCVESPEFDSLAHVYTYTAELHWSGLIWTANRPDMQKIRIIGYFFFKISYTGSLKSGCYYSQHVPTSKPFDHTWFAVLDAITLYSDNRQLQGWLVS